MAECKDAVYVAVFRSFSSATLTRQQFVADLPSAFAGSAFAGSALAGSVV